MFDYKLILRLSAFPTGENINTTKNIELLNRATNFFNSLSSVNPKHISKASILPESHNIMIKYSSTFEIEEGQWVRPLRSFIMYLRENGWNQYVAAHRLFSIVSADIDTTTIHVTKLDKEALKSDLDYVMAFCELMKEAPLSSKALKIKELLIR